MKKEELAALLNGREYRKEITKIDEQIAESNNLVVVFVYSDDGVSFVGSINDEVGAFDGTTVYLDENGLLKNDCRNADCPYFSKLKKKAKTIDAIWCGEPGYSWTYKTDIPHATFDIMEDGEKFCKGIVFDIFDLGE